MDPTNHNLNAAILDQVVAGSFPPGTAYAFVAILRDDLPRQWGLGIAVANESGYNPVSAEATEFSWDYYKDADEFAKGMNRHIGIDWKQEAEIIASTMGGRRY